MTFEYKPDPWRLKERLDAPIDPARCKAGVMLPQAWRSHQCQRKATVDGWCRQHHPDAEAKRREERRERERKAMASSPIALAHARADKAEERVRELEAEVERLRELVHQEEERQ